MCRGVARPPSGVDAPWTPRPSEAATAHLAHRGTVWPTADSLRSLGSLHSRPFPQADSLHSLGSLHPRPFSTGGLTALACLAAPAHRTTAHATAAMRSHDSLRVDTVVRVTTSHGGDLRGNNLPAGWRRPVHRAACPRRIACRGRCTARGSLAIWLALRDFSSRSGWRCAALCTRPRPARAAPVRRERRRFGSGAPRRSLHCAPPTKRCQRGRRARPPQLHATPAALRSRVC